MICKSCKAEINEPQSSNPISICDKCGRVSYLKNSILKPDNIKIEKNDKDIKIIRPFNINIFLILMVVFWDGCLFLSAAIWISRLIVPGALSAIILCYFILIIILIVIGLLTGAYITYLAFAGFINKTFIELKKGELLITHGPLFGFGDIKINLSDIEDIYCTEDAYAEYPYQSYCIITSLKNKENFTILSHVHKLETALFIQEEIVNYKYN